MGRLNQVEHDSKKKCVYKLEFNSGAEVVKNRSLFNEDGRLCVGSGSSATRGVRTGVPRRLASCAISPARAG